jgi:SAM-dependent methyltransferase
MTEIERYSFNPELKIWSTPSHNGDFEYSDGDSVENRLLIELQQCHDVSCKSDELRKRIVDWPSEYHFSSVRHNLLRPFDFGPHHRILELGCGCGAMTRYLGECQATVVAVEGSRKRAAIAAERCRDLPNVSVYCDNIAEFETQERFNIVTLIGVLEYAGLFIRDNDPINKCLQIARSFLTFDGFLILAIENQLGLKYFNGCKEDHLGISNFGIQDLYHTGTPITFGKKELEARLKSAAFDNVTFCYPFPDYKLPNLIFTDEGAKHPNFHAADLLSRTISHDYSGNNYRIFHENMAWQPIARNGLLPELSNSFLVTACRTNLDNSQFNWLAKLYSAERLPDFATETVFQLQSGRIVVRKNPLSFKGMRRGLVNGLHLYHLPSDHEHYISGRLYTAEIHYILARGGNLTELATWAKSWFEYLQIKSIKKLPCRMLPGKWLDAIPSNFVRDDSGNLFLIDDEWQIEEMIPFSWVIIRGLIYTIGCAPFCQALSIFTFREIINQVLILLGEKNFSDSDYQMVGILEDALQNTVYGNRPYGLPFSELMDSKVFSFISPPTICEENETLKREIVALHGEISRIKSTVSWQLTKPLRFLSFLLKLAEGRFSK